nr:MAG TPA: Parvovirus coat protein VP1 [Caudoviricetes sp.]
MPLKRSLLCFLWCGPGCDGGPVRCRVLECCN